MGPWTLLRVTLLILNLTGVCAGLRSSIVGGKDAHKGAWPWMVYLEMHIDSKSGEVCGGTLVSDQYKHELQGSFAWVGVLSLTEHSGKKVKLKRIVKHPNFTIDNGNEVYFGDIALVQLQESVSFSETVALVTLPLPQHSFNAQSECWVTGWGLIKAPNVHLGGKKTLQEVQLALVDDVTCKTVYPHLKTQVHLCAGDMSGKKDACKGDSGGPLMCVPSGEKKRRFVQVGIVSFGKTNGCAVKNTPGVYTRVSNYIEFIHNTTKSN